jgi:hypothetical protein
MADYIYFSELLVFYWVQYKTYDQIDNEYVHNKSRREYFKFDENVVHSYHIKFHKDLYYFPVIEI